MSSPAVGALSAHNRIHYSAIWQLKGSLQNELKIYYTWSSMSTSTGLRYVFLAPTGALDWESHCKAWTRRVTKGAQISSSCWTYLVQFANEGLLAAWPVTGSNQRLLVSSWWCLMVQCLYSSSLSKCSDDLQFLILGSAVLASDIGVMIMSRSSESRFERNLGRVPTEFFGNCTPRSTLFPFSFMSGAWSKNPNCLQSLHTENGWNSEILKVTKIPMKTVSLWRFLPPLTHIFFPKNLRVCVFSSIYLWTLRKTVLRCTGVKFHLVLSSLSGERMTLEVYKFNILENPQNGSWQDVLRMY